MGIFLLQTSSERLENQYFNLLLENWWQHGGGASNFSSLCFSSFVRTNGKFGSKSTNMQKCDPKILLTCCVVLLCCTVCHCVSPSISIDSNDLNETNVSNRSEMKKKVTKLRHWPRIYVYVRMSSRTQTHILLHLVLIWQTFKSKERTEPLRWRKKKRTKIAIAWAKRRR